MSVAREMKVDAVLSGGDLFDHTLADGRTGSALRDGFAELDALPVYLAPGNHDWYGPDSLYRSVSWSANVRVFERDRLCPMALDDGLTLWGAAHHGPVETHNFLDGFRVDGGGVHLALFHGAERERFPAEPGGAHRHAPFDARQLVGTGLHHTFLGHDHRPFDGRRFTYAGSPVQLRFRERGPRGAVVVQVNGDGHVSRDRVHISGGTMHDVQVDAGGCTSEAEVRHKVAAATRNINGIARVSIGGAGDGLSLARLEIAASRPDLAVLCVAGRR